MKAQNLLHMNNDIVKRGCMASLFYELTLISFRNSENRFNRNHFRLFDNTSQKSVSYLHNLVSTETKIMQLETNAF